MLGLMGLSLLLQRLAPLTRARTRNYYVVQLLIALGAVYFTIAAHVAPDRGGVDLTWIVRMHPGGAPLDHVLRAVLGSLAAAVLWLRGARLAHVKNPTKVLMWSFRLGLGALGFAVLVDILHPADIDVLPMTFVFFASALGGLSVGHLSPAARTSGGPSTWTLVIPGVVTAVVLASLVLGLANSPLQSVFLPLVTSAAKALFWALLAPFVLIYNLFVKGVLSFFSRPFEVEGDAGAGFGDGGEAAEPLEPAAGSGLEAVPLVEEQVEQQSEFFVLLWQVLQWGLLVTIVLVVLALIAFALVRLTRRGGDEPTEGPLREGLTEDTNVFADMFKLLSRLVPNLRSAKQGKAGYRIPSGPPGVVDVLRLYYGLLVAAERKGFRRGPYETASEFQRSLAVVFPPDLVRMATAAFDRALYGHHPASDEQIAHMRQSLKLTR